MHPVQAKEDVDRLQQLTSDRSNLAFGSALVSSHASMTRPQAFHVCHKLLWCCGGACLFQGLQSNQADRLGWNNCCADRRTSTSQQMITRRCCGRAERGPRRTHVSWQTGRLAQRKRATRAPSSRVFSRLTSCSSPVTGPAPSLAATLSPALHRWVLSNHRSTPEAHLSPPRQHVADENRAAALKKENQGGHGRSTRSANAMQRRIGKCDKCLCESIDKE